MEPSTGKLFSNLSLGEKLIVFTLSLVVAIGAISFLVYETTKAAVTIVVDGEEVKVKTHADTVADLFLEHDYEVNEHDKVTPALDSKITGNMVVEWKKANLVFFHHNGLGSEVWTTATNVSEFIEMHDIPYVKEHDELNHDLQDEIESEMRIMLESAFTVTLNSDGEQQQVITTSTTVADFLERETIVLGELDRVEPPKDALLNGEMEVKVVRVKKVTDVVEESVSYATVTRKDNSLQSGKEKVVQSGTAGLLEKHYEVILEDGKEVSRKLIKTDTVRESKDRIVAVGTRVATPTVSRGSSPAPSGEIKGRTLTVTATAYTAKCNGCSGITATGINLNNNRNAKVIAVDPSVIPLGTRVHVEGYGTAIAGDTGGAIRGHKIDVHMPTKSDAFAWGTRRVKITILQ